MNRRDFSGRDLILLKYIPEMRVMFRLFGFSGSIDITVFPDTWLRDLPLLNIGHGAYLANRATLGTNMCLNDGSIIVGPITIGERAIVGHLSVIGLGSKLGEGSELGVGAATGIRITVGSNVNIRPRCNLNHGCQIESNAIIGSASLIGLKSKIGAGIEIRAGACIPPGVVINTQEEADNYFSSETQMLNSEREMLFAAMEASGSNGLNIKSS